MGIINWLKLSEIKNIENLDDNLTTLLHGKIIQKKLFLKKLYLDFYKELKRSIPENIENKCLVELGSGGGFIKDVIPNVMTSDIINLPNVDKCFSATNMPFDDHSVDAFLMIDVLHHINNTKAFFKEAGRCLKVSGIIIMIEPANTLWGRFIYQNFHHEAFDPYGTWYLDQDGPLSSANGAIPWIIFFRDRDEFEKEFPFFKIIKLNCHAPFRYLVSGGLSFKQLAPSFTYPLIKGIEMIISPLNQFFGMFMSIKIENIRY